MAIDTAEKRKSISGIHIFTGPGVTSVTPADQEWRQESGYGYPGILADGPVVSVATGKLAGLLVSPGRMMGRA